MTTVVLGLDPGIASMAAVLLRDGRILRAQCWHTAPTMTTPWADLLHRSSVQCQNLVELLSDLAHSGAYPGALAIEAFEDFGGGHLRGATNRYWTPVLLGRLALTLEQRSPTWDLPVHWQLASEVLTATKAYRDHWEAGRRGLIPGDEALTNEHLRSAACHALWCEGRLRRGRAA